MASASLPPPVPRAGLPIPTTTPVPARTGAFVDRGVVRRAHVRGAQWNLDGTAKVTGDVDVDTATLSGTASIGGKLSAGELRTSGRLDVVGDAVVKHRLAVDGSARFGATLHAGDIDVRGTLRVEGAIDVDRSVLWRGTLEAGGAITASRLAGEGRLVAQGAVLAKEVDLVIEGPSHAGAIRAETVRVRSRRKLLGPAPSLEVERIDADLVELEDVHVEYLRASRIVAGAGCQIARYDGTVVRQHAGARLGPSSISARPYGLSR
jgi:cytoskeletal protein CcmA (bactofilin family)